MKKQHDEADQRKVGEIHGTSRNHECIRSGASAWLLTRKSETAYQSRCVEVRDLRSEAKRREERFVHHLPPTADENIGGRVRTMNKMKIAGIIIAAVAAVVFVFLFLWKPHTLVGVILLLIAGIFVVLGMAMVVASEELNLEDFEDEK